MLLRKPLFSFLFLTVVDGQQIQDLFTLDPTCTRNNMQATLNSILTDTRTLLNTAQSAISTVTTVNSFTKTTTRNLMRNARNSFGTKYYDYTLTGMSNTDKNTLNTVSGNLNGIQTLLAGRVANAAQLYPAVAYLVCDDTAYATTSDASVIDPSLQSGTSTARAYGVPYVFYIPNGPTDPRGRNQAVLKPKNNQNRICTNVGSNMIVNAETFPPDRRGDITNEPILQMVLCSSAFDHSQDSNGAAYQTTINPTPGPATPMDRKILWKFTAGLFIHELFHVLSRDNFVDREFSHNGNNFPAYGPENVFSVATNANGAGGVSAINGALTTTDQPDAYRMFCEECYFNGTTWDISGAGG